MQIRNRGDSPSYSRGDGVTSSLLHPSVDSGGGVDSELTVTWVELQPGASQELHSHPQEQVYVLVQGRGRMHVDDEDRFVEEGDLVHVPGDVVHGIENTEDIALEYVSAATPRIPLERVEEFYRG